MYRYKSFEMFFQTRYILIKFFFSTIWELTIYFWYTAQMSCALLVISDDNLTLFAQQECFSIPQFTFK